jgi:NAD(P)-dependent dehydrogenase (short-subunit alcohol dehydrogenase family)
MDVTLDGKIIVITGAARGIGAATARLAAESGAAGLLLTDRSPIETDLPCPTERVTADLADGDAPDAIIAAARKRFGRIDGLVNAAGLTTRGSFVDPDPALWDHLMAVNARAPFFLMAGAIADMRARQAPGSIVNILSVNAHCGSPELAIYAGSKGALQTLTKNAANAHMADAIRVNGINLGWADTETERHLQEVTLGKGAGWLAEQAKGRPLGRLISADDVARLAVYLLADASAPLTGSAVDLEQSVLGAPV